MDEIKIGSVWQDGGTMESYIAFSEWAKSHNCLFVRRDETSFEIIEKTEPAVTVAEDVIEQDEKDAKINTLEQRLAELEQAIAALAGGAE
jgi:hypothetical protein